MLKTYIAKQNFYFILAGTVLKESGVGDYYFVSMSDEDMLKSKIVTRPLIERCAVENDKEHFVELM